MLSRILQLLCAFAPVFFLMALFLSQARADKFTYFDQQGDKYEVQAELAGSGQGAHALQLPDGQLLLVAQAAVLKRETAKPLPVKSHAEVATDLEETFGGKERILTLVDKPLVLGFVLARPVDDVRERNRKAGLLKRSAQFLKGVQGKFLKFIRETRVKAQPLKYPLVVLIFESDRHFNEYAQIATGGQGLSAGAIAGFYNGLSNRLVLRMNECYTFEVPLHEAIHQQVYNRQILQRLAPIPVWFNEGIATGFEGDGKRVKHGPKSVSARYGKLALKARVVDWKEIVRNDRAFHGDVLAGEAYAHAWGLHWLMVAKYRSKYAKYVQMLSARKPLETVDADERIEQFESIVEKSVPALQKEFFQLMSSTLKRQQSAVWEKPGSSFLFDLQAPKRKRTFQALWERPSDFYAGDFASSSVPISATLNSVRPEVRVEIKAEKDELSVGSFDLSIPLKLRLKPVVVRWSFSRNSNE